MCSETEALICRRLVQYDFKYAIIISPWALCLHAWGFHAASADRVAPRLPGCWCVGVGPYILQCNRQTTEMAISIIWPESAVIG